MAYCQGNYGEACLWNMQQKSEADGTEAWDGSGVLSS